MPKQDALEIAEAAREKKSAYPSFARRLFMGEFSPSLLHPFPEQPQKEKEKSDAIIAELKEFFKENLDPDEVDRTGEIPKPIIDKLKEMNLFAVKVPEEYGGLGLSQVNYNRIIAFIGGYCASTAVLLSAHQSIGVPTPLQMFGTEEQKKKFFPRFCEGAISAFALTEQEAGSDPSKIQMTATPTDDGKHYLLNGEKLWITNGPIADLLVIMALTKESDQKSKITAFIVEGNSNGLETTNHCKFMGLRAIENGMLRFTDVKVPAENILGAKGRGLALALTTLNTGRLTIPAATVGMAREALMIATKWGSERVQWGAPIGKHEPGKQKIAFIASTTLAMEAVTWLTSHWADQHNRDIRIEAAIAKLFCSEAAWKIIDQTLQIRAGRGYETTQSLKARGEDPYPVERMMRDCRINTIIEGTSEIMRLFLAREALDPHLEVAGGLLKRCSVLEKMKTFGKMLKFYSKWYPQQWLKPLYPSSYPEVGTLAPYYRFIEKTSHKLARTMFHCMAKYGKGLQKKQVKLGYLIDIGTELFAMSATCAYATMLHKNDPTDDSSVALADYFCKIAQRRIQSSFTKIRNNDEEMANKLAGKVLNK